MKRPGGLADFSQVPVMSGLETPRQDFGVPRRCVEVQSQGVEALVARGLEVAMKRPSDLADFGEVRVVCSLKAFRQGFSLLRHGAEGVCNDFEGTLRPRS